LVLMKQKKGSAAFASMNRVASPKKTSVQ